MSDRRPVASSIPIGPAFGVWLAGWFVGGAIFGLAVLAAMGHERDTPYTTAQTAAVAVVGWIALVGGMWWLSRVQGTGDFAVDFAVAFRPIDLLGIPVGVAGQLLVVPLVYVPLRAVWPDTFGQDQLEERARELTDQATGAWVVVLVLVVAVGAPVVEELVYRGMLQRSVTAAAGRWVGWVGTSLFFAAIHVAPVELPGLFAAGLLFGGALLLTGRVGTSIVVHASFNAAGLAVALS